LIIVIILRSVLTETVKLSWVSMSVKMPMINRKWRPGLASILKSAGKLPDKMSLDNGYFSGDNLQALEQSAVDAYIATDRDDKQHSEVLEESERKLVKSDFHYDKEEDCFRCPNDQVLKLKNKRTGGKHVYQSDISVCASCPLFSRCSQSKKGEARTITTDKHEGLRQAMRIKMEQQEAKEIYKRRKVIVEPVFGQIKNGGFRGFSLRGKEKVAGEFSLVCAAHNIKKISESDHDRISVSGIWIKGETE